MKSSVGIFLLMITFFSGCGKKKKVKNQAEPQKLTMKSGSNVKGQLDEYVFDDSSKVGNFSFIDEDKKASNDTYVDDEKALNDENLALAEYKNEENDLNFERVNFLFNSDKLVKGQQEKLHRNIETATEAANKNHNIDVKAYCCELGSADYNLALSQKRANVIKQEMVSHGISEKKISAVGRGQEYPIAWSNAADRKTRIKELAPNRRAEIAAPVAV